MARKKAETTEAQPEKKATTEVSEEQTAASSGQEIAATETSEGQTVDPSAPEGPVMGIQEENFLAPKGPTGPITGTSEGQDVDPSETETTAKAESLSEEHAFPEEQDSATDEPYGCLAVVCSDRGLNLRAGPALSYEAMEVLPDGAEVIVLGLPMGVEVPGWRLVFTGEKTGWVQSRFLRLER